MDQAQKRIHVAWYFKGLREYTKKGFDRIAKTFEPRDTDVNCTGRSFLITGANSAIGTRTAVELARRGATVHLMCADVKLAEGTRRTVRQEAPEAVIHAYALDISNPHHVIKFTSEWLASGQNLDVLIHNASALNGEQRLTEDGLDKCFSTNTLGDGSYGVHLLTSGLLPVLQTSLDPRVLVVTSASMLMARLDTSELARVGCVQPYDGALVFAQTKRQQVTMVQEYAKRHQHVFFACMHPGWVDTDAVRSSMPAFYEKNRTKLRSVCEGADTLVWLAVSPAALHHASGLFFQDRRPVATHLPLASTKCRSEVEEDFMHQLDNIAAKYSV